MIKKKIALLFLVLFVTISLVAQDNRERVYLHLNSQNLISGESLMISAYCRSNLTGKQSNLSKVLYIEIIGSSGTIYQEKLLLEDGRGSSEFFISSIIPTGKYYVVAYTRWMRNFDDYFKTPIEIINPFEPMPDNVLSNQELEVNFFLDKDQPVLGLTNKIGFKINGPFTKVPVHNGKIVSSTGKTISSFSHDSYGLGTIEYTPINGESYNIILEDEDGNIHFFEMPQVKETGTTIQLSNYGKLLIVNLESKGIEEKSGKLLLYNEDYIVIEQLVGLNSNSSIDLGNIYGAFFKVEILDSNDNLIISRNFRRPIQLDNNDFRMQKEYLKRSHVKLNLDLKRGSYSVSVRKKDTHLNNPHMRSIYSNIIPAIEASPVDIADYVSSGDEINFEAFFLGSTIKQQNSKNTLNYLPEFRNEFLDGQLITTNKSPVPGKILALTVFSESFIIQTAKTDSLGSFSIPFESLDKDTDAMVTPVDLDSTYTVQIFSPYYIKEKSFKYEIQPLDSNQIREVIAKSIRLQIENAYYVTDTSNSSLSEDSSQIDFDKDYNLDDYTRFNSIQETFVEYIPEVSVRRKRNPIIKPIVTLVPEAIKQSPLLLLDGVPVSANNILDFSASNIERISILNNRYFIGPLISDGIVNFKSFEGKMGRFNSSSYHEQTKITGVIKSRPFISPTYDVASSSKLPDLREQLYWNPKLVIDNNNTREISLFTSDVNGIFEVVIEGFQENGSPVSIIKTFSVID